MAGHVFLGGSWCDQRLPARAQVVAWVLVALQPDYPFRILSVMVEFPQDVRADVDNAVLIALYRALQRALPGAIFDSDSSFVVDGFYLRGRAFCCGSRGAWCELWPLVWARIGDGGGIDQLWSARSRAIGRRRNA